MKYLRSFGWLMVLPCILVMACTGNNNTMKSINAYWQDLTTAPTESQELDVLEQLRVYLRDEKISYEVLGKVNENEDSLINLLSAPAGYIPGDVTIKFYANGGDKPAVEKQGWKPKNPQNAFYLFNE